MKLIHDATCLACGTLCDDIRLTVEQNHIVRAEGACRLGLPWFLAVRPDSLPCRIEGQAVALEAALAQAATVLGGARHPLVFGLAAATCEAQAAALSLAARLGAVVDLGEPASAALSAAAHATGMVTASLGEVRHRADLVVFWCADPATTHPRHFERYSLSCPGEFVPRGRPDRCCIVVDEQPTATAEAADDFYQIAPASEPAAWAVLQAILASDSQPEPASILQQTGIPLDRWHELVGRMKAARYTAIFFQPGAATQPLLTFVRDMNRYARCVALPLGSPGNAAGARQVLAWQTSFPLAVSFAGGAFGDDDANRISAESALANGRADAALVVASDRLSEPTGALSAAAREKLASIPTVVLHTADAESAARATIAIPVASPGIQVGGTVFRSDGVALPLRPATATPYPAARDVLLAIEQRLAAAAAPS